MSRNITNILCASMAACALSASAGTIARLPMTVSGGSIAEEITGATIAVNSQLDAFSVAGARGEAMRFDGYSNYFNFNVPAQNVKAMTLSFWIAAETWPMMNTAEAENVPTYTTIVGGIDDSAGKGLDVQLSSQGDLRLAFYSGTWPGSWTDKVKLDRTVWNHIVVMLKSDSKLHLYVNGVEKGSAYTMGDLDLVASWIVGKSVADKKAGDVLINTFCGLIDDIVLLDTADESLLTDNQPENAPNFSYPASRYDSNKNSRLWRPAFHGMPSGGWTNESHGMAYSDGRYHVFFQKNANGPYMARLHWGHISSANLFDWREENIAFGPSESYDIKGCWSGALFQDGGFNNGKLTAIYTAVDNGRATIATATPNDAALDQWTKTGVVVSGRPAGLSDDFRDPYMFKAGDNYYMIVGTSKDNLGACTLHRYNGSSWTNDGSIFFKTTSRPTSGRFWEMSNVTPMGDGKYLFTTTPLETGVGVETQYWVGTINADGTFNTITPLLSPGKVELDGFSKDGYGLLSPTIFQHDGKTIALGIVPDKLPTSTNLQMGWAHNYSLPREWTIVNNELYQKPYSGLTGLRTAQKATFSGTISQAVTLGNVSGNAVEVLAEFEVGAAADFGVVLLKNGNSGAKLSYNPASGELKLDFTTVNRLSNDNNVYNGVYSTILPEKPAAGEVLKMHAFLDHSIFDIFINDRWAASVRIFPTDEIVDGNAVQVYSNGGDTKVKSLGAWVLDINGGDTPFEPGDVNGDGTVDIADVNACINVILGSEPASKYDGRAAVNGDGAVDIADVNAIINIILG